MGYYTRYRLKEFEGSESDRLCLTEELGPLSDDGDSAKWYSHEADIANFMRNSSATRIVIHGDGEETGDSWDKEFTNDVVGGVTVRCRLYNKPSDWSAPKVLGPP